MAFNPQKPPAKTVGDFELIEEGLHPARLARIIELGDQEDKYGVKTKVAFGFTLPGVKVEVGGEMKQRMVWTFPLNMTSNPDSTVMKYIKALNGAATEWSEVINRPCMIEITHKTKDGVTSANLTNVVKPMAGLAVEEPDCDVYIFDFENPNKDVWEKLSEARQNQIKGAKNYTGSAVEAMVEGKTQAVAAESEDWDDDIPF